MDVMEQQLSKMKEGYELLNLNPEQIFSFPEGIPGFEKIKQYCILVSEKERPFGHLSALGSFNLEFIVINPWYVKSDYNPEISDDDIAFIGSPAQSEILMLSIVALGEPISESTVNLMAPVIINLKTRVGRQVAIRNFKEYSNQQPIVTSSGTARSNDVPDRSASK